VVFIIVIFIMIVMRDSDPCDGTLHASRNLLDPFQLLPFPPIPTEIIQFVTGNDDPFDEPPLPRLGEGEWCEGKEPHEDEFAEAHFMIIIIF
jgi:hypothetical protein